MDKETLTLALRALAKRRLREAVDIARAKIQEQAEREKAMLTKAEEVGRKIIQHEQIKEDLSHLWAYRPPCRPKDTGQSSLEDESWHDLAWIALGMNTPYLPSSKYGTRRSEKERSGVELFEETEKYYGEYTD